MYRYANTSLVHVTGESESPAEPFSLFGYCILYMIRIVKVRYSSQVSQNSMFVTKKSIGK